MPGICNFALTDNSRLFSFKGPVKRAERYSSCFKDTMTFKNSRGPSKMASPGAEGEEVTKNSDKEGRVMNIKNLQMTSLSIVAF